MNLLDGINDTEDELYTFDSIIETKGRYDALAALKDLKEACATHMGRMVYILQEDKFEAIEKELKDNENKLSMICDVLVDVSKGNYSDLKVAIEEIREVL